MAQGAARYFGTVATVVAWGFAEHGLAGARVCGEQFMTGVNALRRAGMMLLIALFWIDSRAAETRTQGDTLFFRLANPGEEVRRIRLSGADLFGR